MVDRTTTSQKLPVLDPEPVNRLLYMVKRTQAVKMFLEGKIILNPTIITRVLIKEERQSQRIDVTPETQFEVICFEDEGRSRRPMNAGGFQKPEKASNRFSSRASSKNTTLLTLRFQPCVDSFQTSDLRNYKIVNLCGFRLLSLPSFVTATIGNKYRNRGLAHPSAILPYDKMCILTDSPTA